MIPRPPRSTLFPLHDALPIFLTDLTAPIEASVSDVEFELVLTIALVVMVIFLFLRNLYATIIDRKSTRLNSSHVAISYAVFCLKKKIELNSADAAHGAIVR